MRRLAPAGLILVALFAVARAAAEIPPTKRTFAGITCVWPSSTTTTDGAVVCQRSTGAGFAGVVSLRIVLVKTSQGHVVFFKNQPTHSPGFGPLRDKRIFHSETHRGIICYWTRIGGGAALCNRADRHGYLISVGLHLVTVLNEASKIVFLKNQV
jgi:hypothetical protein